MPSLGLNGHIASPPQGSVCHDNPSAISHARANAQCSVHAILPFHDSRVPNSQQSSPSPSPCRVSHFVRTFRATWLILQDVGGQAFLVHPFAGPRGSRRLPYRRSPVLMSLPNHSSSVAHRGCSPRRCCRLRNASRSHPRTPVFPVPTHLWPQWDRHGRSRHTRKATCHRAVDPLAYASRVGRTKDHGSSFVARLACLSTLRMS